MVRSILKAAIRLKSHCSAISAIRLSHRLGQQCAGYLPSELIRELNGTISSGEYVQNNSKGLKSYVKRAFNVPIEGASAAPG